MSVQLIFFSQYFIVCLVLLDLYSWVVLFVHDLDVSSCQKIAGEQNECDQLFLKEGKFLKKLWCCVGGSITR